jgi:hypothetical protein
VGETQGMTSCGLAVKRPEPWTIDGLSTTVSVFKSPDALALKETLARMIVDEAIPTHHRVTLQAILYEGLVDVGSLLTSTTATRMTQSQSSSQMSPLAPAFEAQNANAQNVQPARSSNVCLNDHSTRQVSHC